MQGRYMFRNLLTFSHTRQPITTIIYTQKKMGVNEDINLKLWYTYSITLASILSVTSQYRACLPLSRG